MSYVILKVQSQAQRVNMWSGSHVVTGDAHLQLKLLIGDFICNWSHKCVTRVVILQQEGHMINGGICSLNSIYSRPFWVWFPIPLSCTTLLLWKATRYIVIHTRDRVDQHHQRNSYTIGLSWYHNDQKSQQQTCPNHVLQSSVITVILWTSLIF
jgi:hypothetical protein